ncbi:MAG TPA: hypothetical protein PKC18_03985 [Lacipirellulaceae bacterium]|nr:hypothetical protein [Lacipirellulaceae bacterium]
MHAQVGESHARAVPAIQTATNSAIAIFGIRFLAALLPWNEREPNEDALFATPVPLRINVHAAWAQGQMLKQVAELSGALGQPQQASDLPGGCAAVLAIEARPGSH